MNVPIMTGTMLRRFGRTLRSAAIKPAVFARLFPNRASGHVVVEVPQADTAQLVHQLKSRLMIERIVFGAILTAIVTGWSISHFAGSNSLILVDGKTIVCVPNHSEADQILHDIKSESGVNPDKVQFKQEVVVARAPRSAWPISRHKAMRIVRRNVSAVVSQWAIIADGKPIVALPDEATASQVLEMAKLRYGSGVRNLAEEPQIREDVKVDIAAVSPTIFRKTADKALDLIFSESKPVSRKAVYWVRSGDYAESIARDHSISTEELWRLNPGLNLNRLSIGDVLHLRQVTPPRAKLTVVVRDLTEREEAMPPPTKQVSNPRMPSGRTVVLDQGTPGRHIVKVATIYENGRKVGSEVMDEQVLLEPRPRVLAVGVKH